MIDVLVSDEMWRIAAEVAEERARSFARRAGLDWRDLVGGALCVVPAAARSWDPTRSPWRQWIGIRLWGAVRDEGRSLSHLSRRRFQDWRNAITSGDHDAERASYVEVLSLDRLDDEGSAPAIDRLPSADLVDLDDVEWRRRGELLLALSKSMAATTSGAIVGELLRDVETQQEIAARLGVDPSNIAQRKAWSIRVLRVVARAVEGVNVEWSSISDGRLRRRCEWCGGSRHAFFRGEIGDDAIVVCAPCADWIDDARWPDLARRERETRPRAGP